MLVCGIVKKKSTLSSTNNPQVPCWEKYKFLYKICFIVLKEWDEKMHLIDSKKISFLSLFFIVVFLFVFFSIPAAVEKCGAVVAENILYVDDDGGDGVDYTRISDAIVNASSGYTIYVYSGTYVENIVVDKTISLVGEDRDSTVIQGASDGHVVVITADSVNITGFTIQYPVGSDMKCIMLNYVDYCYVGDCIVKSDTGSDGVYLLFSNHNTISGNVVENDHSIGVELTSSSDNLIENNVIQSTNGGIKGISLQYSTNNILRGNTVKLNNYGVHLWSGANGNSVFDNTITDNSYGIRSSGSGNSIYHNKFNNTRYNAYDEGSNTWDDGYPSGGNHWSDYSGADTNHDGIGDTPYEIPGGDNQDLYPLVNHPPTAYIVSISPNPAKQGQTVSFQGHGDDDDGYIVAYRWRSSRDGVLSTQSTFSTSSLSVGVHTIYFKVRDNDGEWSEETSAKLTVNNDNQKPTAAIVSINPNPALYGETVYFNGYGEDVDGSITKYKWVSSIDGEIGTDPSFSTNSLSVGTHIIYFSVRDNYNEWSDEDTQLLTILSSSDNNTGAPVADADGSYMGYVNESILFDASQSYDPDGDIESYIWDFGDGNTDTGEIIEHIYTSPGNYTVSLTVIDTDGYTNMDSTYAVVLQKDEQNNTPVEDNKGLPGFEVISLLMGMIPFILFRRQKIK